MKKILIVDDDRSILRIFEFSLRHAGYYTTTALDGAEAIEIAENEKPDLILMDLMMPILDGWEATEKLKADPKTKDIPVVAITATSPQGCKRALQIGCIDVITKPVSTLSLIEKVKEYLPNYL